MTVKETDCMRVGDARVSTNDQILDLQRDALKGTKCRQIYEEHASGQHTLRPQLDVCLKSRREGDTLIGWRLDRLGRSRADRIRITQELQARGVGFASLTDKIDTPSPTGTLIVQVFGALAEFERNLIRERTMASLKTARAQGRNGGRPKKLTAKDLQTIKALLNTHGVSVATVAEQFGIARSTMYRNVVANS